MRTWFRLLTVTAGVVSFGAPGAALAQEEAEQRAVIPAEMELEESKRTAEADRKRDEQIEGLKRIIARLDAGPQKSELLFQLAEIWIEKSKYVYFQEFADYDARMSAYFECTDTQGEEACGPQPELQNQQSRVYTDEALALYEQILKDSPNYPRKDEVLFSLATNLYNKGEAFRDQAIGRYRDLVTQYPNSRFVGDAYVAMGNHYFDANELFQATAAFTRALESSADEPRVYNYALYKLAWCEYNGGEYEGSLAKFQEVVERAELARTRNEVGLRDEALRDMVLSWQKLEKVEEAHEYYQRKVNRTDARRWFARLADKYFSDGDHALAISSYRLLIDGESNDPRNPEFQKNIVQSYEGMRQRDKVLDEMRVLVDNYKPGSAWAVANKDNERALAGAYQITEEAMRGLVTDYHQEAQRTKEVKTYRLAAQIYKDYLDSFSDSDYAYNLRFYYAEILWTLEEWELAAEQYEEVYALDADGSYATTSAYNTLLAYEKLIAIDKGELERSNLRDDQKVDEDKDKGQAARSKQVTDTRISKDVQPEEIPIWEAKMIAAADRYAVIAANDPRLSQGDDEIQVRYKAAFIYYDRKHFTEAAVRFGDIILKWPEDRQAKRAADLSLNILEIQEEWYELARLSRAFYENEKLAKPGDKWTTELAGIMEGSQYKYIDLVVLQEEKRELDAAKMFREFVTEFPKSEHADRALLYSMRIYTDANLLDETTVVGEQILANYPDSEFRPEAMLRLATAYQDQAYFREAINYFTQYAQEWEIKAGIRQDPESTARRAPALKSPAEAVRADPSGALEASNALYNAALWTEGLGDYDAAVGLYREYIQKYSTVEDAVPSGTLALNIALIFEKGKDWEKAESAFADFINGYASSASAGEIFFARYRRALALTELGRTADARNVFETITTSFANLPEGDQQRLDYIDAYAHAHFILMERNWGRYQAVRLDNVRTLQRSVRTKMEMVPQLEADYIRILEIGSGDWGIAALTRIGQMYQEFARNLVESPDPAGLTDDQLMMYRIELEDMAFPLEEKAVEAYELALEKSYELAVYNEYTILAQEQINRFMPGEYGTIREVDFTGSEFFAKAPIAETIDASFDIQVADTEEAEAKQAKAEEQEEAEEDVLSADEAQEETAAPKKGVLIMDNAAAN